MKLTNSSEGLAAGPVAGAAGGGISWPRKTVKGGNNKRSLLAEVPGLAALGLGLPPAFPPIVPHPTSRNSPGGRGAGRAGAGNGGRWGLALLLPSGPLVL